MGIISWLRTIEDRNQLGFIMRYQGLEGVLTAGPERAGTR